MAIHLADEMLKQVQHDRLIIVDCRSSALGMAADTGQGRASVRASA